MSLRLWLSALCLMLLSGCGTTQVGASWTPKPPDAEYTTDCQQPADIALGTNGQDFFMVALEWKLFGACERTKRHGLIQTWPR